MERKYVIGLDYGTLSGRAVIVDCDCGEIIATSVKRYEHGVLESELPSGKTLPAGEWALQVPQDYMEVLKAVVPDVVKKSGVDKQDIIGIGLDFTSCTILPVDKNNVPLCMLEAFREEPHAYVKLWKHHGAQEQADRVSSLLAKKSEIYSAQYGGRISSELLLPKIMQILEEAPEIYEAADQILEAGDWMTQCMTGGKMRSADMAGYKAMWNPGKGYPSEDFLYELNPALKNLVREKLGNEIAMAGECVGQLTENCASQLGLSAGIPVSAALIDSHAGLPGSGVTGSEQMMMVLGTSSVMLTLSKNRYAGNGIVSGAKGAVFPDNFALESGIAAVGDMFGWYIENMVPYKYVKDAEKSGKDIHTYLSEKASELVPGASGIIALDWWNGNKTPYIDGRLSGVLVGCTLNTKPEEIYRALLEATAFGTRQILELFMENQSDIHMVIASGGIVEKNPLMMQIYADVLKCEIRQPSSDQTAALGASICAAAAAGEAMGGYASVGAAIKKMSHLKKKVYYPDVENTKRYDRMFSVYCELVKLFNPNSTSIMKKLSAFSHRK